MIVMDCICALRIQSPLTFFCANLSTVAHLSFWGKDLNPSVTLQFSQYSQKIIFLETFCSFCSTVTNCHSSVVKVGNAHCSSTTLVNLVITFLTF